MNLYLHKVTRNPVLNRELKERMRRRGTPPIITVFLLSLTVVFWLMYQAIQAASRVVSCFGSNCIQGELSVLQTAGFGRQLFQMMLLFILVMVCFIVPALTAGAIAGERERQTLIPIQITLLRPSAILVGKLASSLAFMVLLIIASLPLVGATFVIGGVSIIEVLSTTFMVLMVAIMLGSTSLLCSTYIRRSQAATVASYGMAFILIAGTFVPMAILPLFTAGNVVSVRPATMIFLAPNPLIATASVLQAGESITSSPLGSVTTMIQSGRNNQDVTAVERGIAKVPFWILSLLSMALITVGSIALASRKLRTPASDP